MNKTQNDAPFVAFYDMHSVTFVLPDEMADVSIAGLQWFILVPGLNHTAPHRPIDFHSKPYLHQEKKYVGFGTRTSQPAAILRITGKAAVCLLILVASNDMEKGRGPILYSKNTPVPHGTPRGSNVHKNSRVDR